jgi:hypothetical protein
VNHQPILGTAARWASWDLSLLVAAGSLAISLIPVYSREYSAMVLLLLVLWCFRKLHLKSARWLLFLLCDFLVNTATVVRRVVEPKSVARHHQDLWDATIGGHECWLLLAIGCLLVWAVREQRREDLALLETQPLIQPSVIQPMPA